MEMPNTLHISLNKIMVLLFLFGMIVLDSGTVLMKSIKLVFVIFVFFYLAVSKKIYINGHIKWLTIFCAYSICSILWSYSRSAAISGAITLAINSLCIYSILQLIYRDKEWENLIFPVLSVFPIIYSIKIMFQYGALNFFSGARNITEAASSMHNIMGIYCAFGVCFAVICMKKSRTLRGIYWIIITLNLCIIVLSGSRKAIIYILVSLVVYFVLKRKNPFRILRNIIIGIIFLLILLYIVWHNEFLYTMVGQGLESMLIGILNIGQTDSSTAMRMRIIQWGLDWFHYKPVFGYGLENFAQLHLAVGGSMAIADNNYIELLVDLGLTGVVLYYFIFLIIIIRFVKNFKVINSSLIMLFGITISIIVCDYGACSYKSLYFQFLISIIWLSQKQWNFRQYKNLKKV
ncbi:O-antigen ligase family protein [Clostridium ljungdahlii]|uniref:O-Antigen ligase n=1 Tax=Clostridium ljungdahlii TaxID=1538 RepID=A0A168NVQ4_9CLOT|nr:O-antigen ligase family protein [Clostridium ljungdahlii]OAA86971.1 O-Antigen ligase [Clostridium ljungdahlii]